MRLIPFAFQTSRSLFVTATAALIGALGTVSAHAGFEGSTMLSFGKNSNAAHIYSITQNPASVAIVQKTDSRYRAGMGGTGFGMELGDVDNFFENTDDLIELLEGDFDFNDPLETLNRINPFIEEAIDDGYVKFSANFDLPFLLSAYQVQGGKHFFSINYDANALIKSNLVASRGRCGEFLCFNAFSNQYESDASLFIRSAVEKSLRLNHAMFLRDLDRGRWSGQLYFGSSLELINFELSQSLTLLEGSDDDEDSGDLISDNYDRNKASRTDIAVDVGLLFVAERYQLGLTVDNLIFPQFEYTPFRENCFGLRDSELQSCAAEAGFVESGALQKRLRYTPRTQLTVEGAYSISSFMSVGGSLDLNSQKDPVGDRNQFFTLYYAMDPQSITIIPSLRLAYHKNLEEERLSSLAFGMTLLHALNLDFQYSLDSTEDDGDSVPRGLSFALSFEQRL